MNDNTDIFTIEVNSGRTKRLTRDAGGDDNPVWWLSGKEIAYVHMPDDPPVYASPRVRSVAAGGGTPHPNDVVAVPTAGGAPTNFVPQSEQLYLALKTLGKETALIIYPDQSHSIRRPTYEVHRRTTS